MQNEKLGEELHKPIIEKYQKQKVRSYLIDNISGAALGDMQLLRTLN